MAEASVGRPLTQVSQKPLHGSGPNFVESYLSAISPDRFIVRFSKYLIFKFLRIFSFSLTWDPMGAKISKRYFSHNFDPISPKRYDRQI